MSYEYDAETAAEEKKAGGEKENSQRRKINAKNMATIIVSVIVVLSLIGGSARMVMIGSMIKDAPKIDINNFESKESTQILDKDGNLIQDIGQQIRTNVSYEDMPTSLVDAFVAVEDSRYFEHNGFDLPRFAKAFLTNLKTLSFSQGGSTFTMQLVKTPILPTMKPARWRPAASWPGSSVRFRKSSSRCS